MPRILGVDIPQNKKVPYSLAHLYGIGLHRARIVCTECGIDEHRRAHVFAADRSTRMLGPDDDLTLPGVLPDFRARVASFFE